MFWSFIFKLSGDYDDDDVGGMVSVSSGHETE